MSAEWEKVGEYGEIYDAKLKTIPKLAKKYRILYKLSQRPTAISTPLTAIEIGGRTYIRMGYIPPTGEIILMDDQTGDLYRVRTRTVITEEPIEVYFVE